MSTTDTTSKSRSAPLPEPHRRSCTRLQADNYRDAEGHAFAFSHCVKVLHQLPKLNPMVDDADRTSDVAAVDSDGNKKPAASVNKIGAPMGDSLKRPP
jgi:hypothetical protein